MSDESRLIYDKKRRTILPKWAIDELNAKDKELATLREENAKLKESGSHWRCFHCGFQTSDPKEAEAHFGDEDDPESLCTIWASENGGERLKELQQMTMELNGEREENTKLREENDRLKAELERKRETIRMLQRSQARCMGNDCL